MRARAGLTVEASGLQPGARVLLGYTNKFYGLCKIGKKYYFVINIE
jgi:hypothetical protein